MTGREAILYARRALEAGRPDSPFLDASLLLATSLEIDRSSLLARLNEELSTSTQSRFFAMLERRIAGEAIAYLIGKKEFFGIEFHIDKRVLVPRPETELLVETVLELLPAPAESQCLRYHDAFAGSGCVGLSVASMRDDLVLSLSDISPDAIDVININAKILKGDRQGGSPQVVKAASLSGLDGPFCGISANPPYVKSQTVDRLMAEGSFEPRLALDGGADGLKLYPEIAAQAFALLSRDGFLALEIGDEQGDAVSTILSDAGFTDVKVKEDLAGQARVVYGIRP